MELKLPLDYHQYTDKYFCYSKLILQHEQLNPVVKMRIFARGKGKIAALASLGEILDKYAPPTNQPLKLWLSTQKNFTTATTLAVIEAPIQSILELETIYLGVLSYQLSQANNFKQPNFEEIKRKFAQLHHIYQDVPIVYFGARHYHCAYDKLIAQAAIAGGAVQTSTDIGSSNINLAGVGTMPHVLVLLLASRYGIKDATLISAQLFDKYIEPSVPRITLVDTFNHEIHDSLAVAQYFANRQCGLRVDTCGENIGEGGSAYPNHGGIDPSFKIGKGVTIELIINLRNQLIEHGYASTCNIFLSSGFGQEAKAQAFMTAQHEFRERTGFNLFAGVGIGEAFPGIFCTADIASIEDQPLAKTGRPTSLAIDYSTLQQVR
jgi:nicotinate phosphoribosyltransferase